MRRSSAPTIRCWRTCSCRDVSRKKPLWSLGSQPVLYRRAKVREGGERAVREQVWRPRIVGNPCGPTRSVAVNCRLEISFQVVLEVLRLLSLPLSSYPHSVMNTGALATAVATCAWKDVFQLPG